MRQTVVLASVGFLIAATAAVAGQHAEPAKAATAPHASEPAKPAASAPTTDAHGHAPATGASRTPASKTKSGADNGLSSALLRIQERIDNETGTSAKPRPATARRVGNAPSAAVGPAPVVTLTWKTTIAWPAELMTPAPPNPPPAARTAPIELTWK